MRKDFVPFTEFEGMLRAAGLTEVMFLRQARLGIYTVREWRRHHEAPAWALEFCRMAMELRHGPSPAEPTKEFKMDPVLEAMTEQEMLAYGTSPKLEMMKIYERAKARMLGDVIKAEPTGPSPNMFGE
jgi:hypothetical protein